MSIVSPMTWQPRPTLTTTTQNTLFQPPFNIVILVERSIFKAPKSFIPSTLGKAIFMLCTRISPPVGGQPELYQTRPAAAWRPDMFPFQTPSLANTGLLQRQFSSWDLLGWRKMSHAGQHWFDLLFAARDYGQ